MNLINVIMILGAFTCCAFMQALDNKKLGKRIQTLEEKVFPPEVSDDKKGN